MERTTNEIYSTFMSNVGQASTQPIDYLLTLMLSNVIQGVDPQVDSIMATKFDSRRDSFHYPQWFLKIVFSHPVY